MKISLITNVDDWHTKELIKEAQHLKVNIEKNSVKRERYFFDSINDLGDIVFWRSSSLGAKGERAAILDAVLYANKRLLNPGLVEHPFVTNKFFQQEYLGKRLKSLKSIRTFIFGSKEELLKAVETKELKFPFIKKPQVGSQGNNVELISDKTNLINLKNEDIENCIFQEFIANNGDFRILVLGGRPLGVIKRVGKKGSFVNNFSKGGNVETVANLDLKENLLKNAAQVAALFKLGFCGVDLIMKEGAVYFMEVNTVPEWRGFQKATKINVAKELIEYFKTINSKDEKHKLVEVFYNKKYLGNREIRFHFFSRMYLWTGHTKYLNEISELKDFMIGRNEKEKIQRLKKIINEKDYLTRRVCNSKSFREKIIKKYPQLGIYHKILFGNLMNQLIFKEGSEGVIRTLISDNDFIKLRECLYENKENILKLSTFAVNFLYLLKDYLGEGEERLKEEMLNIFCLIKDGPASSQETVINNIYFLTHCIIGESRFYSRNIDHNKKKFYTKFLIKAEAILINNYFKASLDNKLEFLVCCKIIGYKTKINNLIEDEIERSFSEIGNFVVDKFKKDKAQDYFSSEHRNVLYLMSKTDFRTNS